MKKIIGIVLAVLMLFSLPVAFAQETDETADIELEEVDPGVTPDSPVWGLERAMEKISLAFTFDKAEKARKRLENANERLAEVDAMIKAKKMEAAEKAEKAHDEELDAVAEDLEELEDGGTDEELKDAIEIETLIKGHQVALQNIRSKLEREGLTEEQQAKFGEIVAKFEANTIRVAAKAEEKKENVKTKLMSKGASEDEVEDLEIELEEEVEVELEDEGKIKVKEKVHVRTSEDEGQGELERERESEDVCTVDADCEEDEFCNEGECEDLEVEDVDDDSDDEDLEDDNGQGKGKNN